MPSRPCPAAPGTAPPQVARLFTAEEEKQLQTMLGLSAGDLATVLNACTFIFEQAGHHALKPAALRSHLERTGLSADHVRASRGRNPRCLALCPGVPRATAASRLRRPFAPH